MKIETEPRDDHQVKLTVEVEADLLEEAKRNAARKLSRRVKIPGFRPGKAPYQVVLRQYGEAAIMEDAIELLIEQVYPKMIEEAQIKPYGPGKLDNIVSTEPPVFEFVVPLDAEVKLGDYTSIKRPYEPKEVSEQDVDEVIENLQDRQAILEPVERPVEEGDVVTLTISGEKKNVEAGEDPTILADLERQVLVLPENEQDEEWPFPGFSRATIGMSAGEEKITSYTFPEDTDYEELRGVEAVFKFTVNEIKNRILPEVNDELAQSVGEYENLAALRAAIRENLEEQARETYNETYDEEILQEAVDQAEFKYPPQMLEDEIDQVIRNLENRLSYQNLDLDLYLKTRSIDMDGLREEARPSAETRLKKSLILYELAQAEDVQVGTDEVQVETMRTMDILSRSLSKKEAKKLANEGSIRNVMNNVMADLLTRKAMERLRSIASGIGSAEELVEEQENQEVGISSDETPTIAAEETEAETSITEAEAELEVSEAPPSLEAEVEEKEPSEN